MSEAMLRTDGEQHWLGVSEAAILRQELLTLVDLSGMEEERSPVQRAIELVDYAIATGTGVAVVPPPDTLP